MTHADWLILGYTTVIIIFGIVWCHIIAEAFYLLRVYSSR